MSWNAYVLTKDATDCLSAACPAGVVTAIYANSSVRTETVIRPWARGSKSYVSSKYRYNISSISFSGSIQKINQMGSVSLYGIIGITSTSTLLYSDYSDDLKGNLSAIPVRIDFTNGAFSTISALGTCYVYSTSSMSTLGTSLMWQTLAYTPEEAIQACKRLLNY